MSLTFSYCQGYNASCKHQNDSKEEVIIMMNVFKKFAEAYNENKVAVICGMAMMNGNTNVYPLYEAMTDESK
jgi:plastocyanin domain-containing protein